MTLRKNKESLNKIKEERNHDDGDKRGDIIGNLSLKQQPDYKAVQGHPRERGRQEAGERLGVRRRILERPIFLACVRCDHTAHVGHGIADHYRDYLQSIERNCNDIIHGGRETARDDETENPMRLQYLLYCRKKC